jgi:nitronate monooxygenase
MAMWTDRRVLDLFQIEHPIVLSPMAGVADAALAIAVAQGGGLGSLPCGMLDVAQIKGQVETFRAGAKGRPVNLNFFVHVMPARNNAREHAWREALAPYYRELGVDPATATAAASRMPFDDASCALVEEIRPEVVSFHYGLPEAALLARVQAAGCKVVSSATTVAEARWLADHGCDAVIAQGFEAGGHRGMFLNFDTATQVGTFALLPQIVDAVSVPVIAAGGIADARGIVAALALGASAVQIGTAYLHCPESKVTPPHRAALKEARDDATVLTNVISGRPARGFVNRVIREMGPISDLAPDFPYASAAVLPLHAKAQAQGSGEFSGMLAGQAAALGREMPAQALTQHLVQSTQALLRRMAG